MKKITLLALFTFSNLTFASGIPTADVAANAQLLAQAKQDIEHYTKQIEEMKNQLNEMENIKNNLSGNWSEITGMFFESSLNAVLNSGSLTDIYETNSAQGEEILSTYELNDVGNEKTKERNKEISTQLATYENMKQASFERQEYINSLAKELKNAQSQAQKTDIMNRLMVEQLLIQNESRIMNDMQKSIEADEKLKRVQINEDMRNKLFAKE